MPFLIVVEFFRIFNIVTNSNTEIMSKNCSFKASNALKEYHKTKKFLKNRNFQISNNIDQSDAKSSKES